MNRFVLSIAVAGGALAVAGGIGGAEAQIPGVAETTKSVTVNGVGDGGLVPTRSQIPERHPAYRAALDAAMEDARTKAGAIAEKAGVAILGVNSVSEEGSAAGCSSPKTKTTCGVRAAVSVVYDVQ